MTSRSAPAHRSLRRFPPENFLNRELGLLAFNRRVLSQARNAQTPLLERLRFLCIVSSNLDEFFEIRMAGLKEQIKLNSVALSTDGKTAREAFRLVSAEAHALVAEQYALFNDAVLPQLAAEGVRFLRRADWTEAQRAWIGDYFFREVMPVLTPIGLDPSHPFPRVLNKSLNFAVELEGKDAFGRSSGAAIVQAPRVLPRVIQLPHELCDCDYGFVFLSSILHGFVGELFAGMEVRGCYQFRVTRNSDLFVDEEEVKNLRAKIQGELPQRHFGDAVRLEVADNCSAAMSEFLLAQFGLGEADLYRVPGPVNIVRLMQVPDQVLRDDLKFQSFQPGTPKALQKSPNIFDNIRTGDVLLHHPYQSFAPVIELLDQAAVDPQVVAIKMTVYRTGTDSVLMQSLLRAAQNGKEVTVIVELMARFDEEANIGWATKLEEVGAHVVYGVVGYKTHAKMLMIVRREGGGKGNATGAESVLRRYVHLGTGNYHPRTARLYTDFGLLTCNEEIGSDVNEVFKQLTGLGRARRQARAHHRQDELAARTGNHRHALRGLAGRRQDRPDRARRLRPAAGDQGPVREHPRALDRRPLARAPPHFLFLRRRRGKGLSVERRLDGTQLLPAHRTGLPGARPQAQAPRHQRGPAGLPRRQPAGVGNGRQRRLPPASRAARQAALRAGRTDRPAQTLRKTAGAPDPRRAGRRRRPALRGSAPACA